MVLRIIHFGKYIRNTWEVLKFGSGEGWGRLIRPLV
jgi:hypothetical protein